jgi:hypothetical protein
MPALPFSLRPAARTGSVAMPPRTLLTRRLALDLGRTDSMLCRS